MTTEALRTPEERFAMLPGLPYSPTSIATVCFASSNGWISPISHSSVRIGAGFSASPCRWICSRDFLECSS